MTTVLPPLERVDLSSFAASTHSQFGEDGILAEIFRRKGIATGYFCEFGAWDGQHCSNSYALYERGWKGIYIEADPLRFKDLKRNIDKKGMALVQAFVSPDGPDSLNAILARSKPAEQPLDLLSIDIDSDDLAIWQSLTEVKARVVVIEYNPTIPVDVYFKNIPNTNRGNSARAIYEHAISQDYELIAQTTTNMILIDSAFNGGEFTALSLEESGARHGTRYFFGYDGTLMLANLADGTTVAAEFYSVPWSKAIMPQPIPRILRHFDDPGLRYNLKSIVTRSSTAFARPIAFFKGKFSMWRHRGA